MPENDTVDVRWLVGIAGESAELPVTAAYVHQPVSSVDAPSMITLRDANHKIVFQGPIGHVQYVRRRQDPEGPVPAVYVECPSGLTPRQVRELQGALNAVKDERWPGSVIVLLPDGFDED